MPGKEKKKPEYTIEAGGKILHLEMVKKGVHQLKTGEWNVDDAVLDQFVTNFVPGEKLPGNIDHVKKGPAKGRIVTAYREDDSVFVDVEDIPDAFMEQLKEKEYWNRSVEAVRYKNGQHKMTGFAWLGAGDPGVKGMKDFDVAAMAPIQSNDIDALFHCSTDGEGDMLQLHKEVDNNMDEKELLAKIAKLEAEAADSSKDTVKIQAELDERNVELEKVKAKAEETETEKKTIEAEAKVQTYLDGKVKEGRVIPAMINAGLKDLMVSAHMSEDTFEIQASEGKGTVNMTPVEVFEAVLDAIPEKGIVNFETETGHENQDHSKGTKQTVSELLAERIKAKKKELPDKEHSEIVALVTAEAKEEGLSLTG